LRWSDEPCAEVSSRKKAKKEIAKLCKEYADEKVETLFTIREVWKP